MAKRRMFSLEVCDTDNFLDMPASTQALYFHLGLRADDRGFVGNPKKITAMVNCSVDDLKLLIAKNYLIPFETGVCVIRDWQVNNYIQKDRFHETRYLEEKAMLQIKENQAYILDTTCIQNVSRLDSEVRLELELGKSKSSLELGEGEGAAKPPTPPRKRFVPPGVSEVEAYCSERKNGIDPAAFVDYYATRGWKLNGGQTMKDWRAAVRTWERNGYNRPQASDRDRLRTEADYSTGNDFFGGDNDAIH